MDFFERQHTAKRNTRKFVVLFCFVMLVISFANHMLISVVAGTVMSFMGDGWHEGVHVGWFGLVTHFFFDLKYALAISFFTAAVILLLALYKYLELREGGAAVAEMLGGRKVDVATEDIHERRLMNVVEEMAIASGVPVPEVFIFDKQRGINAFAAGYTVDDCVIGITEGCTRLLTRDELQGVIAHEFSHILNQDMRLNLRLVVFVYGLIAIAVLGHAVAEEAEEKASYMRGDEGPGAVIAGVSLLGNLIYAFGAFGTMLASLVKCAVSREREYLADASAVQFTRNPEAFAGTLKKIAVWENGSRVNGAHACELSHMFFGSGLENEEGSLRDTHPPILKRIKLVTPSFDGDITGVQFPAYPNQAEVARAAHLSDATLLWVESNPAITDRISERLGNVAGLNFFFSDSLNEVRSLFASHRFDYVIVNASAVDWFDGDVLDEFVLPAGANLFVMASDSSAPNALDALENAEREVVEKPFAIENLPFQIRSVVARFDCHFMGWYGVFLCLPRGNRDANVPSPVEPISSALNQAGVGEAVGLAVAGGVGERKSPAQTVTELIGAPKHEHVDFAGYIVRSLPETIRRAVHDTHDACGLVFALLIEPNECVTRTTQLQIVQDHFGEYMAQLAVRYGHELKVMDSRAKLPVVDLAIGALRQLSEIQYVSFKHVVDELVQADEAIDLFEYSLSKLIVRHLDPHFGNKKPSVVHIYSLKNLSRECSVLVSVLANVAGGDPETVQAAFDAGRGALDNQVSIEFLPPSASSLTELDEVLARLNTLEAGLKRAVVNAAAATVAADGHLQRQEAELLRAICDGIGCPIPPLAIALEAAA